VAAQDDQPLLVLGADGCKGGSWVVAMIDGEGELSWHEAAHTQPCWSWPRSTQPTPSPWTCRSGCRPLGGTRTCDAQARRRVGARSSSVFAAPPREVLACSTYAEARPLAPSMSAQAFGLVPRIREVDGLLRSQPVSVHRRVVECHPEVSFASMAAGRARLASKRSAAGALQRIALIEELLAEPLPHDVPASAALDDALDAAACAMTAHRWVRGEAEVLGGEPDAFGVPMRIVV
jgi:predicted RNase H-like nuclease